MRPAATGLRGNEPAAASDHPGARHHADAGLGLQLLPAGHSGRPDRPRSRHLLELDLCGVLRLAGDLGHARPARRPADRPGRRPLGAVHLQPDAGRRPRPARLHLLDPGADRRLAAARHRHGHGPLRRRLRRARPHLWRRRAALDHRHHADCGLCLHRRLAAHRARARAASAGATPALPGRPRISCSGCPSTSSCCRRCKAPRPRSPTP